jgi:uncharacterized repeat protein (TIGR02543 family)
MIMILLTTLLVWPLPAVAARRAPASFAGAGRASMTVLNEVDQDLPSTANDTQASVWSAETVGRGSPWLSLAVVDGQPAISYDDGANNLNYARFDGNSWQVTTVDSDAGIGIESSLAVIAGQPAISYYEPKNRDLKYAYFDGNIWQTTTVDNEGNTGWYSSLVEIAGRPAISYFDNTNNNLNFARFDGAGWQITIVDSGGEIGRYSSLALVDDQPAISYYDFTNGDLKIARFDGSSWQRATVDSTGDVGLYTSLAVVNGQPAISYYDKTNGDLKYARYDGNTWQITPVDSTGDVGSTNSLAVVDGQPAIGYYDKTNGDLKYARYDGNTWQITPVDSTGDVGWNPSLVVIDGLATIGYYDSTRGTLKVARNRYLLTGTTAGSGAGSLTFSPPGGFYAPGTVVTVTATPATRSSFASWSGDCAGTGSCVLVMDSNKNITATFTLIPTGEYPLSTATTGTGSGAIHLDPPGGVYSHGAVVTATALSNSGSTFTGWNGDCAGTGPCTLVMDGDKSITATFTLVVDDKYNLTAATTGSGSGAIHLDPPGGVYPPGTVVTAAAIPNTGSLFAGWSGDCTGIALCVLTMDGNKSITATFTSVPNGDYRLATATTGAGSGAIILNPPGGLYVPDTVVTATALPNIGSTFAGWSGDCTGTGLCVLTMDRDRSISAAFVAPVVITYSLTTAIAGAGSGAIHLNPPDGVYPSGTVVTLTAVADPTSTFVSWGGECSGSDPCVLEMDGDKSVTAFFARSTDALPGVAMTQSASVATAIVSETEIGYTYQVTNSGAVALTVLAVADRLGPVGWAEPASVVLQPPSILLQPGQTTSGSQTYTPRMSDLPGPLVNRVVVTGVASAETMVVTALASTPVDLLLRGQAQSMCYGDAIEALLDLKPIGGADGPFDLVVISGPAPSGLLLRGVTACLPYTGQKSMIDLTNTLLKEGCAEQAPCNQIRRLFFDTDGAYTITIIEGGKAIPVTFLPLVWTACATKPACR